MEVKRKKDCLMKTEKLMNKGKIGRPVLEMRMIKKRILRIKGGVSDVATLLSSY